MQFVFLMIVISCLLPLSADRNALDCCRLGFSSKRQPKRVCFWYQACLASHDGPSKQSNWERNNKQLLTRQQKTVCHCKPFINSWIHCSARNGPILHHKGRCPGHDPQLCFRSWKAQHQVCESMLPCLTCFDVWHRRPPCCSIYSALSYPEP